MYFPLGWPKILQSSGATSGKPVKVFRHRTRDIVIELRESSVAFWHARLCVLVASFKRSQECVDKHGVNTTAVIKPDGSEVVIATLKGHLLFLRVNYEKQPLLGNQSSHYAVREYGILLHHSPNFEVGSDGTEVDSVTLKYLQESAVVGGIHSLFCLGNQLVVATGYGVLHRLSWEGKFDSSLAIHLNQVPIGNDLLPESKGQALGEVEIYTRDVFYSPEMHGLSVVLSDGRGAFIHAKSARYEPQSLQGVWMKDLSDAVCTAINARYQLLAFGKENGVVDVFGVDDSTGMWLLSHTLQFTRRQFPETSVQLGAVQCMEWSYGDAMVIAVSWKNGGLSLWSVFGALLLCSLGDQPGTPSPLNPHFTILESLCWSCDGYHLWMLPIDASAQRRRWESLSEGGSQPSSARSSLSVDGDVGGRSDEDVMTTNRRGGSLGGYYGDGNKGCVLIMRFLKNSIINNPVVSNHEHLFLQGSDRLYLNTSKSVVSKGNQGGIPSGNGMVSSPQWKVIQLPLSYLMLNWPVKYVAVNSAGSNIAIAGKAGFALYSGVRRKWKLFGNEVQEQGLVCRGGLLWFKDIIVFPCRVQEKLEEVRFYSLRSNLDNSQLLHTLKLTSPIMKLNLHGNHLVLGSRDCHMTIFSLNITVVPNKGLSLSVTKIHELSLANSIPYPWATTLISMVPSSIRTESGVSRDLDRSVDSVLFNISGRLLMIQHELPRPYLENQEDEWTFSSPVCLAQAVEAIWTPLHQPPGQKQLEEHLLESLWLACGATGIKVWLPLYPRDESHPSFLAKRIMLTLPIAVYPQAVLFQDAVLFGLSHETAFNETCFSTKQPFPFSTVERTAHIFLHHILRQLLRRNLGSHALQIARSCSHLPYFSHVLELMLHEVLEEEAPGAMPVPDALLPRVVEFIKQFPEFLETVGSCARKTEVALWQYLFAAVGNPRDLFELCISDGRLKTATTYLIIIQNLEVSAVSRQLATRLLDASLDNNQWELCRDIVRFLRAIGPADAIESPAPSSLTVTPATPHKTPLATPTPTTSVGVPPSLIAAPDLDRSAMSVTRDHLTSGSTSSVVSFSGEFKDAFGKVIRRPQFVMDVDSKEEYFIELILSRHARKLLTSGCLRDLGKLSTHLDFSLPSWLARERLRAARVDDFVGTLRELHKEFQWPFPTHTNNNTTTTTSRLQEDLARDKTPLSSTHEEEILSPLSVETATPTNTFSPEPMDNSDSASVSSIKRARRPPDLDLSPAVNIDLSPDTHQSVTVKNVNDSNTDLNSERPSQGDFDPTQSSTPTRTGSVSEKISLVLKQHPSSVDLQVENSSLGDIMEETDWDLGTEVTIATRGPHLKGSTQAEKEIRYFIDVTLESLCIEWTLLLGVLLLDSSVVSRIVDCVKRHSGVIDQAVIARILNGAEVFHNWAESECSGYTHYLEAIHPHLDELRSLLQSSPKVVTTGTGPGTTDDTDVFLSEELNSPLKETSSPRDGQEDPNASLCTIS